jgi:hypothetical protein
VKATLDLQLKAAVAPAATSDATWAGPLAAHGIAREALQLQRGASILGALEGKVRRVPFRTHVARETGTGTGGAWVAEGNSTPVVATAVLTDRQLERSQDKQRQRLLAGMKPATKRIAKGVATATGSRRPSRSAPGRLPSSERSGSRSTPH